MKHAIFHALIGASILTSQAQEELQGKHLSLKLESQKVIEKGNSYLISQQNEKGYWGDPNLPAMTGFVIKCLLNDPAYDAAKPSPAITKGLTWLLAQQKEDGGIYGRGMATYSTASSIMALWAAGPDKYKEQIIKARNFLINHQTDWGVKGENDTKFDGGIGYGGSRAHSDLSNTHRALEALYTTRTLATDSGDKKAMELDWEAALAFVSCQTFKPPTKVRKLETTEASFTTLALKPAKPSTARLAGWLFADMARCPIPAFSLWSTLISMPATRASRPCSSGCPITTPSRKSPASVARVFTTTSMPWPRA